MEKKNAIQRRQAITKDRTIKVQYDGEYPNLCRGTLTVIVDGIIWRFPDYVLNSGGSVWFDEDWPGHVEIGEWGVTEWPVGFSDKLKQQVVDAINNTIPYGCCGGCM